MALKEEISLILQGLQSKRIPALLCDGFHRKQEAEFAYFCPK
jgi:hypothetical protein